MECTGSGITYPGIATPHPSSITENGSGDRPLIVCGTRHDRRRIRPPIGIADLGGAVLEARLGIVPEVAIPVGLAGWAVIGWNSLAMPDTPRSVYQQLLVLAENDYTEIDSI